MSSDEQWTALGPAYIGFQTNSDDLNDGSGPIRQGAAIGGQEGGVRAYCQGTNSQATPPNTPPTTQRYCGVEGYGASLAVPFNDIGDGTGVYGEGGVGPRGGTGVHGKGSDADFSAEDQTPGVGLLGQGGATTGALINDGAVGVSGIGGGAANTTPSGAIGVYGQGGDGDPDGAPGVRGVAGASYADGVQGFGSGHYSGVAGFGGDTDPNSTSDPYAGTGVYGQGGRIIGGTSGGAGVWGIGGGGGNTGGPGPIGVYGQGGPGHPGVKGMGGNGDTHGTLGPGLFGIGGGGPDNATAPGPAGVAGIGGYENPGVYGQGGQGISDGVEGRGSGSGVAGFGVDEGTPATGVYGEGAAGGSGVRGVGSPNALGGVQGEGNGNGSGVAGIGGDNGFGVLGIAGGTPLPANISGHVGVAGIGEAGLAGYSTATDGVGVAGITTAANSPAVIGYATAASGAIAAHFKGDVVIDGGLMLNGGKSAVVPCDDGGHLRLYCMESPESWFEDFGEARLVDSQVEITIDPDFAQTVHTDRYHVFLTEYDDNHGLYVAGRTETGFTVHAKSGSGVQTTFSYRIVAKRADIDLERLAAVSWPAADRERLHEIVSFTAEADG